MMNKIEREMMTKTIYRQQDIREVPAYGVTEAAHYLRVPASTIRWWVTGRSYHIDGPTSL